jgi:hypothetical protein
VNQTVAWVRRHEGSLSGDRVRQLTWETRVLASHLDGSRPARKALGHACHRLAYECRVAGNARLLRRSSLESVRYDPFYWKGWCYLVYALAVSPFWKKPSGR